MGRSGTTSLWSSGFNLWLRGLGAPGGVRAAGLSKFKESYQRCSDAGITAFNMIAHRLTAQLVIPNVSNVSMIHQSYRVKPHEQLVLVSLTHYCASTPSLSTSWSRTTLQGDQVPGKTHLETSFPLRCFQRLSLPHLATRQCHWRDNRYTRGASTPVLSY